MATMLKLLQEFLGQPPRRIMRMDSSNESRFSNCTTVEYDDDVVGAFLAWLRSTPAMEERSRPLLVTTVHARRRRLRTIGSSKLHGDVALQRQILMIALAKTLGK